MTSPPPLLLRWQGSLADWHQGPLARRLPQIAGVVICALMAGLPVLSRGGLGLLISASGLLWILWALRTPAGRLGSINLWILGILAIATLATGFSPVPVAAFKGLLKLISYLGVYALLRELLAHNPRWWDRIVAALLGGSLLTSVLGIRQLFGNTEELARWADPNSVADGTIRIYGTLENPNLLGGYLLAVLPLALAAVLRWSPPLQRLFAASSLGLGLIALVLTYSRGAWMGMVASLGLMALLLVLRQTRSWPPLWRRLFPLLLLLLGAAALVVLVTQVEPLRVRVLSLVAGREDSSNNFRINVWMAALKMVEARPWLGIGPGNTAFNLIYPLFQQPKFNALSAYSIPLEIAVEAGLSGLLVLLGLLGAAVRSGLRLSRGDGHLALPALASLAMVAGLGVQGLTDTIFFRPEVQVIGWFGLAVISAGTCLSRQADPQEPAAGP
ncbi:MAG: IctB family putative bicarbonate transporter [Cyanobacteriota bacterium]|nr:IctB family putative bicarbonate transporter [Cyanobacteriota bacterium]